MENAKKLAQLLIQTKQAACVQLKEVTSIYEWDGKVEEETEIQLTIKCDLQNFSTLESFIKSNCCTLVIYNWGGRPPRSEALPPFYIC